MERESDIFRDEKMINTSKKSRQRRRHDDKYHIKSSLVAEFYPSLSINTVNK